MRVLSAKKELNYLRGLFFLFGFLIMSWIPRFPEVKANLGLSNGAFGTLVSTSAVGALISLFVVGHLIHNHGAKVVMSIAVILMVISINLLTSTHSSLIFLMSNIVSAGAIAAFHISINTQGFNYQDRRKAHVITLLSGFWSSGALVTAVVSGILVDRISLTIHIAILSIGVFLLMFFLIQSLSDYLVKPDADLHTDYKILDLFKGFHIDTLISGALFSAILLEYSVGDWSAIYLKEDIGIKSGLHTLPYILFTLAMIAGRLSIHNLFKRFPMQFLIKAASLLAGISFLTGVVLIKFVGIENKNLALIILCISFTFAGLGSSFLGPSIMNAANTRSSAPASVMIGQLGVINQIATFVMRLVIAWTAQTLSLSWALMIPALLLLTVPCFSKIFKRV